MAGRGRARGTSRPARRRCSSPGGRAQVLEVAPQLADLVAQPRRVLEAQLVCGGEQLLLELDDELAELLLAELLVAPLAPALLRRDLRVALQELGDVRDALDDRLRRDPVLLVVGDLDRPAAVGLADRRAHRLGLLVGVHQHGALLVARRAPDRLDQRRLAAQEALLGGVQDRHGRDLREVEPLAQEVHADEHVVLAEAQVADDLDPLQRVDLRVQVAHAKAHLEQVVREVLAHLLRERGDQHALLALDARADLVHQVVDLVARLAHVDTRIDDAGRAHDLLDDAPRAPALVLAGRRRDVDELVGDRHELVERLRPVVQRARQPEAVVDQRLLARAVALVHAADLRHGLVGLVDEADEVAGEVVEQAVRARAGGPAIEDPRVVLDAVAEAHLPQHLHVVLRALAQAMRLEQLALRLELGTALVELAAYLGDRALHRALLDVVVRRRPDGDVLEVVLDELSRQRVEVLQALDLVAEHRHAEGGLLVGGEDLERLPAHAERPAAERRVVTAVLDRDELAQEVVAVDHVALAQDLHVHLVGLGRAEAEDGADAGDDDDVAPGEERGRRRVAQAVDLLVDGRVLLDVEIAARDVGLGLVVVVVGDEVLDRVLREERAELVAQLGGQRLVVREDERGLLDGLDRPGHRHRLAGARGAEQRQGALAGLEALGERDDGVRLVGGRGEGGVELERRHRTAKRIPAAGRKYDSRKPHNGGPAWKECAVEHALALRVLSNERLAALASRGDGGAFEVLYERHRGALYRYCHGILRHHDDAQDAVQATMTRALTGLGARDPGAPRHAWLLRAPRNRWSGPLRRGPSLQSLAESPRGAA